LVTNRAFLFNSDRFQFQADGQPETGKITVKMINHYGDEVLKVFDVK